MLLYFKIQVLLIKINSLEIQILGIDNIVKKCPLDIQDLAPNSSSSKIKFKNLHIKL